MRKAENRFGNIARRATAAAAIALAALMVLAACDTGGDTSPPGPQPTAAFESAAAGINYVFTVYTDGTYTLAVTESGSTRTSAGTCTFSEANGVYTLAPGGAGAGSPGTFTVTTSGGGMIGITGTIAFSDGSSANAPGTLTPATKYTAAADGSSGTADSTAITFTFDSAVSGLAAGDITLTNAGGNAAKGELSGSGTIWTLAITVNAPGNITVQINKSGIERAVKTVAVYKKAAGGGGSTTLVNNVQVYDYATKNPLASSVNANVGYTWDYMGNRTVPLSNDISDVDAAIPGGKLTVKLGTPKTGTLEPLFDKMPSEVTVSAANAQGLVIISLYTQDGSSSLYLEKNANENALAGYCYVDRDVTVNGSYIASLEEYLEEGEESSGEVTTYTEAYNLNLKAGWNQMFIIKNNNTQTQTFQTGTLDSGYRLYLAASGSIGGGDGGTTWEMTSFPGVTGGAVITAGFETGTYTEAPYTGGAQAFNYYQTPDGTGHPKIAQADWPGYNVSIGNDNKLTVQLGTPGSEKLVDFSVLGGDGVSVDVTPSSAKMLYINRLLSAPNYDGKELDFIKQDKDGVYGAPFFIYCNTDAMVVMRYNETTMILNVKQGWNWDYISGSGYQWTVQNPH